MPKCPKGMSLMSTCMLDWIQEQVDVLFKARERTVIGRTPTKSKVWEDLLLYALPHYDPATGWLKQKGPAELPAAPFLLPVFDWTRCRNHGELYDRMDQSWYPHWMADPDNQNLHVNPALENYAGCPDAQWRGRKWLDRIHPEDQERVIRETKAGFETRRTFPLTYRLRHRDGHYDLVFDYAQPWFPNSSYAGYIGAIHFVQEGSSILTPDEHGLYKLLQFAKAS